MTNPPDPETLERLVRPRAFSVGRALAGLFSLAFWFGAGLLWAVFVVFGVRWMLENMP